MSWAAVALLAAASLLGAGHLGAQDVAIPPETHVPILVKLLNFDRNLPSKVQRHITIGVLYQSRYRTSLNAARAVRAALKRVPDDAVSGYPIRVVDIELDGTGDLAAVLRQEQVHALYVTPMRGIDLGMVLQASRAAGVRTLTGVPDYVERGVAVGVDRQGSRSQIVINLAASRAEGADFTAQLLKLARIVKEE